MKYSKRFISLLSLILALAMTLSFFAMSCKKSEEETDTTTEEENLKDPIILEYGESVHYKEQEVIIDDPEIAAYEDGYIIARKVGSTTVTINGQKKELVVNPALVDVVLFTGQSNMVGRETAKYTVNIPHGMAYEYKYNGGGSLEEVKNPVGETFGEVEVSSGSSIVPKFCEDYVKTSGHKIVAVHVARGGRAIAEFVQRSAIYNNIVEKYSACIKYLEESGNFKIGCKFYVMYQGESDTNHGLAASSYISRYMNFHNGLKKQLGITQGCIIANGRNTDPDSPEGVKRIFEAQIKICKDNEDIIMASVLPYYWYCNSENSYFRSDKVHLNEEGLKEVASDACKNILNYMGLDPSSLNVGVDPVTSLEEMIKVPESVEEAKTYLFDFENGDAKEASDNVTLEKVGNVTPKFDDGIFKNNQNNYLRYHLSAPITLSKSRNWSIEWKGKSYSNMNNNASILFSNGGETFLTFQNEKGVYLRNGNDKFYISENASADFSIDDIYSEHVWKVVYDADLGTLSVYMDEKLIKSGRWNIDLVFCDMLGCTMDNKYTFVGELDYIRIDIG